MSSNTGVSAYRTDIQALRGLAVLFVLIHHAYPGLIRAGFLGVDIFFVVSGYLITGIIRRNLLNHTFTFADFYFRRAKRLLPAAYVVFLATALCAFPFLSSLELIDFGKQLLGAVTFTGNVALWLQTGYFDTSATLKPLLHVWSLAIEEQYYLLLPAALAFTPVRWWLRGAVVLLLISLVLCLVLAPVKPAATFYLLPTRGWELAIGSIGALGMQGARLREWIIKLFWPALVALVAIPILGQGGSHPGLSALLVCISTLVVILRGHHLLNRGVLPKFFAAIGAISYSLYLVHWPIFAFANNAYVSEVPTIVRTGLLVLSVFSAMALYWFVELPVRSANWVITPRRLLLFFAPSVFLIAFGMKMTYTTASTVDYAHVRRPNHGFGVACEFDDNFSAKSECRNKALPKILVWGDSFAEHLVPAIAASSSDGVQQATKSVCGPFLGLSPIDTGYYKREWSERCMRFNDSVLEYLRSASSIEIVVLSSPLSQYMGNAGWDDHFKVLLRSERENVEHPRSIDLALTAMSSTIRAIRATGKRVVVVAPPPISEFDVGRCLERIDTGKLMLGADFPNCDLSATKYEHVRTEVLRFLRELATSADVAVIGFEGLLCDASACRARLNGKFVYRDSGHFSYDGGHEVGVSMNLGARIVELAR